ncbi:NAD-dependent epimerase/dehydratase family protein [Enterovirga sp. CN4-39]|uniref:NAD-dependent epimerase/dehydratase family protein n=1 Tax=Enterovirga sp. CN4-39 TaxID=3400910 RepID=UPI003C067882
MATLVTGSNGLIGRALTTRLLRAGRAIVVSDQVPISQSGCPAVVQQLPGAHRWHEVIVRHGITDVVHAGGISGPMQAADQPAHITDVNLLGLVELLEAARIHGLRRVVWFSSIMACGKHPADAVLADDVPLRPDTVYGATKAAGEAMLRAYRAEHGVDAVALRVAGCYGPGRTTSCLIRTLLEDGLQGRETLVKESEGRTRQHVFVEDVVEATVAALDVGELRQPVYNIGPGRAQDLRKIVAAARRAVPSVSARLDEDGFAWNTFPVGPLSIDAARRDLGFEPRTGLAEGAAATLDWLKVRRGA